MNLTACIFAVYSVLVYALVGASTTHRISKRIVNGEPAYLGTIPYQVSLQIWNGFNWAHFCGGTLITLNKVVTAAHCVDRIPVSSIRVGLGWLNIHKTNGLEQNIKVAKVVVHSDYIARVSGFPYDIGMITLATNATINQDVKLVPLIPQGTLISTDTATCVISGWGDNAAVTDGILTETTISVISNQQCAEMLENINKADVFEHHICVFEKPKAACNGDSGGPLVCDGFLVGVSSYGVRTCTGNYPSVYGMVSFFYDWIIEHISD